ncbi:MAG: glutamine synthetase [Comamonadaceae bacterium]|nr:glutamine synthetase [Comamonadaceae bacterium]
MLRLRRADRGPAHRDRARASTRRRSLFSEALEAADRAILFKTGAKEIGARFGIMPSFMAKWSQQLPGLLAATSTRRLSDGKTNLFYDAKGTRAA